MPTAHPFQATRWSVVLAAGGGDRPALDALCGAYWFPLYAFARHRGLRPAEAEDAVQGFFVLLLERTAVAVADPRRGRFRSFLLSAFTHHLADERDRALAAKRGGGRVVPLPGDGEARLTADPSSAASPEAEFDRRWALEVIDGTLADLAAAYAAAGKAGLFAALRPALTGAAPAEDVSGLSPGAAKVALHRLRARWRERLRERVADTLGPDEAVADELAVLRAAASGRAGL